MSPSARSPRLALLLLIGLLPGRVASQARQFTVDDVLDVRSVSVGDLSDDGRWVVITAASLRDRLGTDQSRFGDPTYIAPSVAEISVVDTRTGEARKLFPDQRQARGFAWSPDAAHLAFLLKEGDAFRLVLWERARNRLRTIRLPQGRIVADNAPLQWSADGSKLLLSLRAAEWPRTARERFLEEVAAPIVVQSSEDPFLSWEEVRSLPSRQIPSVYHVAGGPVQELMPEAALGNLALTADGSLLRYEEDITSKTDYTQIFGRERKLQARPVAGGEAKPLLPSLKDTRLVWSGDGRRFAYAKDGKVYAGTLEGGEPKQLAGEDAPKAGEEPADSAARAAARERREKARFTPVRLSQEGDRLVATNNEGFWLFDTGTGERSMFLAAPQSEDDRTSPRYEVVAWSKDGNDIYLSYASRTAWERGIVRYDFRNRERLDLVKDARQYAGFRLSADGTTMVLTIAEGNHPADVYVADGDLKNSRRLTDANPGVGPKLSKTELIRYLDADGDELNGVLYYPLGYQSGTRVPTVFIVYEEFFDDRFNPTISFLTSNGYAVMQPSVDLERGFPGEAWLKGVTAAATKIVELGIADPKRLGVHGTSYGGYATNLLITQTDRFAAAINISGKTDMISF